MMGHVRKRKRHYFMSFRLRVMFHRIALMDRQEADLIAPAPPHLRG